MNLLRNLAQLCLLFWVQPGFAQHSVPGLPLSQHFAPDVYQAGSINWQLTQDARGFLYVANHIGLLEFDGNSWRLQRGKLFTGLKSVVMGENQRLYAGGQGQFGYFETDEKGQLDFVSLDTLLPEAYRNFDEVWDVYPTADGIYFCTHKYIFHYQEGKIRVISHPTGIRYAFYCNYELYVSGWEEGLLKLTDGQLVPARGGGLLSHKDVRAFLPLNNQEFLIGTLEGELFTYDGKEITPWQSGLSSVLQSAQINRVLQLRDGRLAFATQNAGVYIWREGERIIHLDKDQGLLSHSVMDLYEDSQHNLWVAQTNGLTYVHLGAPFRLIDERQGLRGEGYAAIQYEEELYLGTSNGVFRQNGEKFVKVPGSSGQVFHFSEHRNRLLLGHHTGPYVLDNQGFSSIGAQPGAWMFQPVKGRPDLLLQGHYAGLLTYEWKDNAWQMRSEVKGFSESARLFFQDKKGYVWVSHGFKGVFRLQLDDQLEEVLDLRFYNANKGFPADVLINVFQVQNRLVFGTTEGAYVYDYELDRFKKDAQFEGLIGNDRRLIELEEDVQGNMYHLSDRELEKFQRTASGELKPEFVPFGLLEPLISDNLEDIIPIDFQRVLITSREGFIAYNPSQPIHSREEFPVYLREIRDLASGEEWFGGNQPMAEGEALPVEMSFPYEDRAIRIRVAAPLHEAIGRMKYRFRISELDADWTSWSELPTREISGWEYGVYEIWAEVEADGLVSRQKVALINIRPPWYHTPMARMMYLILFAIILGGVIYLLWNLFNAVREELTTEKQMALESKEKEMEKITQESQQAIQQIREEQLKADLDFKNQELASSTMHLLAKNAFLQQLKDQLDGLVKPAREGKGNVSQDIRRIVSSINQNINDEEEWERFSFHFSQVHEDFFSRIKALSSDLTPQELKLCAYLRMNMSTKEIAQLLNISVRGVETSRYRLRKKLDLDSKVNLVDFMMDL